MKRIYQFLYNAAVLLPLVCTMSVSCRPSTLPKDDYVRYGICSPVRSFRVTSLFPDKSCAGSNVEVTFNRSGRVEKLQYLFRDGSPSAYDVYSYDRKGRLIRINNYDADGMDAGRMEYEYDGWLISKCTQFSKRGDNLYDWVHSNDGREITGTVFYADGVKTTESRSVFEGNLRHESVFDADGALLTGAEYEYFDLTNKLLLRACSPASDISIGYNADSLPCEAKGTMIDACGSLYLAPDAEEGETVRYEYEYDEKGNWIRRNEYRGGRSDASDVLVRDIVY